MLTLPSPSPLPSGVEVTQGSVRQRRQPAELRRGGRQPPQPPGTRITTQGDGEAHCSQAGCALALRVAASLPFLQRVV